MAAVSITMGKLIAGIVIAILARASLTTQGVYTVTEGNTYYFEARAWRQNNPNDDECYVYLYEIRIIAVFYAT